MTKFKFMRIVVRSMKLGPGWYITSGGNGAVRCHVTGYCPIVHASHVFRPPPSPFANGKYLRASEHIGFSYYDDVQFPHDVAAAADSGRSLTIRQTKLRRILLKGVHSNGARNCTVFPNVAGFTRTGTMP